MFTFDCTQSVECPHLKNEQNYLGFATRRKASKNGHNSQAEKQNEGKDSKFAMQ